MKKFLLLFFLAASFTSKAEFGFFGTPLSSIYLNRNGVTDNNEAGTFNNKDFGYVQSFIFKGGMVQTYKNSGGNVCGAQVWYRIYPQGGTAGSFTNFDLAFGANLPSSGDQRWESTNGNVDLIAGLQPGVYKFEIYFQIKGNATAQTCDQDRYESNGGSNYVATFSIGNNQFTADFRSRASGNFTNAATWEYNILGLNYATATQPPGAGNNVALSNGHTINLNQDYTLASGKNFVMNGTSILIINPALSFNIAGAAAFNNQSVILSSTSNGTARIGTITGSLTGASNITIERYIPGGRRSYRYLGHPFSTQTIAGLQDDIDVTGVAGGTSTLTNAPSAFKYNPNAATAGAETAGYQAYTNVTDVWTMHTGIAVLVRGAKGEGLNGNAYTPSPVTLDLTGAINQGDQVISLIKAPNSQFNLVANPYPSAVNISASTRAAGVGSAFYLWDPYMATSGAFRTISFSAPYVLPSLSSFFVEATSGTASNNVITFHETDKTAADTTTLFRSNSSVNKLTLQIASGNILWDVLQMNFDDSYNTLKEAVDATKLMNPEVNLYSFSSDNKGLAIDNRPVTQSSVIPLGFKNDGTGNFTFRVSEITLPLSISAFLKDKYNGNSLTPLINGGVYNFSVTADAGSAALNRFEIVFTSASPLPVVLTNVSAYTQNTGVEVKWSFSSEKNMNKYDVERSNNGSQFTKIGTVISRGNTASIANYSWHDAAPLNGTNYYRIRMVDRDGKDNYSNIVKLNLAKGNPDFSIYPNPVVSDQVSLTLENIEKGIYNISISDKIGQVIFRQQITLKERSSTNLIHLPMLSAGTYNLSLIGDKFNKTIQIMKR